MPVFLYLLLVLTPAASAAAPKPTDAWQSANETYFVLPVGQSVYYPAEDKTRSAPAWGLGYRLLGSVEGVARTGAMQVQRVSVHNPALGVDDSLYLLEMLAGAEYISPLSENNLRFTASALGNFGLAGGDDLFMAPMITAGVMYQTRNTYSLPSGIHLAVFWRLTEIHVSDAGGRVGKLRPALGLRLGYAFPGFWGTK